jgi:hypothetical protein
MPDKALPGMTAVALRICPCLIILGETALDPSFGPV